VVLAAQSDKRREFARAAVERFTAALPEGPLLIKPNVVSHEPYPTTTYPDMLDEVLGLFSGHNLIVADGPGADLLRPAKILREHELGRVCARHGLELLNVYEQAMSKVSTAAGVTLELSGLPARAAGLVSLPVLKSHKICMMTGALKNHFGFLSKKQRGKLHFGLADIHQAIAALHQAAPGSLVIMDAIVTEIVTNEMRHGGQPTLLGYLLAGIDPVALDAFGLTLLQKVEPALQGLGPRDIPYLKYAAEWGLGELEYQVEWIEL